MGKGKGNGDEENERLKKTHRRRILLPPPPHLTHPNPLKPLSNTRFLPFHLHLPLHLITLLIKPLLHPILSMLVPRFVAEYRTHGGGEAEGAEDGEEHAVEASEGVREEERGVPGGVRVRVGAEEGESAAWGELALVLWLSLRIYGRGRKGKWYRQARRSAARVSILWFRRAGRVMGQRWGSVLRAHRRVQRRRGCRLALCGGRR
jgi:hypothetical protein